MDPLSITASIIAVLGAASNTGGAIKKLRSLRKAPEELEFLFNELEAFRGVLLVVQTSLRHIKNTETYKEVADPLMLLLHRAKDAVEDFQSLLEYQLRRSEDLDKHGRLKVDRSQWLHAGPNISRVRQRIRDAREDINTALNAYSLVNMGENFRQLVLQIQSIQLRHGHSVTDVDSTGQAFFNGFSITASEQATCIQSTVTDTSNTIHFDDNGFGSGHDEFYVQRDRSDSAVGLDHSLGHLGVADVARTIPFSTSSHNSIRLAHDGPGASLPSQHARLDSGEHLGHTSGVADGERSLPLFGASSNQQTITISATLSPVKCAPFCGCQCHTRTRGRTPTWLKNMIGQLMFDYTSLLYIKPCNFAQCRKSVGKSHFLYRFPVWIAMRMIELCSNGESTLGAGADWSLKIPVVIPGNHPVLDAVYDNNWTVIREMLSRREIGPHMVSPEGRSFVQYAIVWRNMEVYHTLVQSGFHDVIHTCGIVDPRVAHSIVANCQLDANDITEYLTFTRVHKAIVFHDGLSDSLDEILQQASAEINEKDRSGQTPLHWACWLKNLRLVKFLLAWKANLNAKASDGYTPLHCACRSRSSQVAEALLEHGAFVDPVDDIGATPLFYAWDLRLTQLLVSHGADVLHRNNHEGGRETLIALHAFADSPTVQELAKNGAEYGQTSDCGRCATHWAIFNNALTSLCQLREVHNKYPLLQRPTVDRNGDNFLHYAALRAKSETLNELARWDLRGHDPYAKSSSYGDTPDDCFYHGRADFCSTVRDSFDEDEKAWIALMDSAARQNGCEYKRFRRRVTELEDDEIANGNNGVENGISGGAGPANQAPEGNSPREVNEEEPVEDVFVDASETI